MQIIGIGACPAGSASAGIGITIPVNKQPKNVFEARYLDPITKDFSYNSDGTLQTMPNVRQRVMLCLLTTKNSSTADYNFGNEASKIKTIDNYFEDKLKQKIKSALYQLTNIERVVRIDGITINEDTMGRISYQVSYTDLTNNQQEKVNI